MSHSYVTGRLREALDKAGGDTSKAQRILAEWVQQDELLLRGLVAPHLKGIITHAVMRIAGGAKFVVPEVKNKPKPIPPVGEKPVIPASSPRQAGKPAGAKTISRQELAAAEGSIGAELLKSMGLGGAEEFGQVGFGGGHRPSRKERPKTSVRHIKAIQSLIEGKGDSDPDKG